MSVLLNEPAEPGSRRGRLLGDAIVLVERPGRVKRTCGIAGATVHAPVAASEGIASGSSRTRPRPPWTEFTLHVPRRVATAVRVGGGAADTDVDGVRRTGLAAGTVLASTTAPRPVRRRR
ncbi:MAG TPA: hypothetical protein VFX33_10945, partial [Actinomycetales bacterium]|nr:hypothetical protein [Actinomycetales bacterium]